MPKQKTKVTKKLKTAKEQKVETKKKEVKAKRLEKKPKVSKEIEAKAAAPKKRGYLFTVGRRKSAIARVRYYKNGSGEIIINNKDYRQYFPYFEWQNIILEPLVLVSRQGVGKFIIKVEGGGQHGQAESIRLGISRILLQTDNRLKKILRTKRLLTRDSRVKERKKYGLKKARRAPQWQKR